MEEALSKELIERYGHLPVWKLESGYYSTTEGCTEGLTYAEARVQAAKLPQGVDCWYRIYLEA